MKMFALASQIRAGRALLGWTISDLADKTGMSRNTIAAMEKDGSMRNYSSREKVYDTFLKNGVELFPRDGLKGAGVRFATIEAEEQNSAVKPPKDV